ncbi:MAG: glycosyltransferase family 2 protein [Methylococcales bacterium]|jgi:glycosyltransferase involved in cell wall biosynthesis
MGLSALVITPTTGSDELYDALVSVHNQSYDNVEHLIVVDGEQFNDNTNKVLSKFYDKYGQSKVKKTVLPYNTGGGGFYGHRVMAGFSHLVNHDYILFLDQDNFYDESHVESLVNEIDKYKFEWAYSLRTIVDKEMKHICEDNCESLGRWPAWVDSNAFLIDTSSYCFTKQFIRTYGHIWDHGWGADRRFYTIIKEHVKHNNYGCTGKHTLNYRLGGNDGSVQSEFFLEGNKRATARYGDQFPWSNQPV